jgi:L-iditol 2-dehydrogenase
MKALMKFAPGDGNVEIMEVEEPKCGDDQVKIEVAYCGVCGTDIHVLHDTFRNYPPVVLGHEFSGTVVEVGRNVLGIKIGERAAGLGATAVMCGRCEFCRSGHFIFCKERRGMGHGVNGAFTKYVLMRPDQLFPIPESFSLVEAALSEPFAAAVQAVTEIAHVRPGDFVLVSGPGPIGLLCLKLLALQGAKIIVAGAEGDDQRLEAAIRFGAARVVNVAVEDLDSAVAEFTSGSGINVAFECAGVGSSIRSCLQALRPMGQHVQVAICGRSIEFPIDSVFYKQLTLSGSVCYTENTWARMMRIFAAGRLHLDDLISHRLPISDWTEAFQLCSSKKALKVMMYPVE